MPCIVSNFEQSFWRDDNQDFGFQFCSQYDHSNPMQVKYLYEPCTIQKLRFVFQFSFLSFCCSFHPIHLVKLSKEQSSTMLTSICFKSVRTILTLKDLFISESCIEIKIELNFYFRTSLWCLKRFYEGLKGLH